MRLLLVTTLSLSVTAPVHAQATARVAALKASGPRALRGAYDRALKVFGRGRGQAELRTENSGGFTRHAHTIGGPDAQRTSSLTTVEGFHQGKPFTQVIASTTRKNVTRTENVTHNGSSFGAITSVERRTEVGAKTVNRWRLTRSLLGGLVGTKGETVIETQRDRHHQVTGSKVLKNRRYLTIGGVKVLPLGKNLSREQTRGFVRP